MAETLFSNAAKSFCTVNADSKDSRVEVRKVYETREEALVDVDSCLRVRFPGVVEPRWTCEAQREAVLQMMYYNGDMDLHLPTGFGKSFAYQIPGLTFNKNMVSVVVIPFVPLTDQTEAGLQSLSLGVTKWKAKDMKGITEKDDIQVVIMSGNCAGNGQTRACV
jgi:superfamily II DNA or RNA helicase